jgi:tetratricopeptide (TPR) repeat protein
VRSAAILCGILSVGGCVGAAADHEIIADEAYADGRFADALVEYQLAVQGNGASVRLHRKAAAAAIRAGDLIAAVHQYAEAADDGNSDERDEAIDGLVRVARTAVDRGEGAAFLAALEVLRDRAPEIGWAGLAPQALETLEHAPDGDEGRELVLHAAAGAGDARGQDSLMLVFGRMLHRAGRCADAAPVYESLVRRDRDPAVTEAARESLVSCTLHLGRAALDAGQPTAARTWFELAASRAGESTSGRIAYLGLGDVRFALGDALGAIEAYEQARAGLVPGDSVYQLVVERLDLIVAPLQATPDSE